jgi:hypothetical protein
VCSVKKEVCEAKPSLSFIAAVKMLGALGGKLFMFSAVFPFVLDKLGCHDLRIWDTDPRRNVGHQNDSPKLLFLFVLLLRHMLMDRSSVSST